MRVKQGMWPELSSILLKIGFVGESGWGTLPC